jgi:hypothetical protein
MPNANATALFARVPALAPVPLCTDIVTSEMTAAGVGGFHEGVRRDGNGGLPEISAGSSA